MAARASQAPEQTSCSRPSQLTDELHVLVDHFSGVKPNVPAVGADEDAARGCLLKITEYAHTELRSISMCDGWRSLRAWLQRDADNAQRLHLSQSRTAASCS